MGAVKCVNWSKASLGRTRQVQFDREVGVLSRVEHPHLVSLIGIATKQRPMLIVMELCLGGCVFDLLHASPTTLIWPQRLKMCRDVALAMTYLHSFVPQIIHRDLKSLNLLLQDVVSSEAVMPHVKVSDFGLSRMRDCSADWGKMTKAAGTNHWMAPEVYTSSKYDEKADVYSYAMILFEIICREIPFEEEEAVTVGELTMRGYRPDLAAVPPDCPRKLQILMRACWRDDPRNRPSMKRALEVVTCLIAP
eukprot:NODE_685_length_1408_cov_282.135255.p1 GENE.NODE_685_length_1408_cov_282.135255~~NODE_685_length_1408_cov_282.135255.p1  ORF type:complete len:250 (-),score=56.58 NODE_685_length_1408_cov_282.135255:641-1390(-)